MNQHGKVQQFSGHLVPLTLQLSIWEENTGLTQEQGSFYHYAKDCPKIKCVSKSQWVTCSQDSCGCVLTQSNRVRTVKDFFFSYNLFLVFSNVDFADDNTTTMLHKLSTYMLSVYMCVAWVWFPRCHVPNGKIKWHHELLCLQCNEVSETLSVTL